MKLYTLILFFLLSIPALSSVTITQRMTDLRALEFCLSFDILEQGKPLPESLEDIPTFKQMVIDNPYMLVTIDRIAVVPKAPLIRPEPGVSNDCANHRLFAIYREKGDDLYTYPKPGGNANGRYAILIAPDGSVAPPRWIPEPEAQIILKQLDGFDPAKQPVAFQGIPLPEKAKQSRRKNPDQANPLVREDKRPSSSDTKKSNNFSKQQSPQPWALWIAGIMMLLLSAIWYIKRNRHI